MITNFFNGIISKDGLNCDYRKLTILGVVIGAVLGIGLVVAIHFAIT